MSISECTNHKPELKCEPDAEKTNCRSSYLTTTKRESVRIKRKISIDTQNVSKFRERKLTF
ncbi:hypothetical protein Hanom_Chr13g01227271 [Helianthus anomalus]